MPPRIIGFGLVLITLLVYLPAGRHDFIVFDDADYVTENRVVQEGITWPGIVWAFTSFHASNWHPVTWLSHMLDCELFGLDPGAQHLVNTLFHAVNAGLLFLLLVRWTGRTWPAAVVAALFAWHPLRVESVAWIAERKDVLNLFFGLLCLLAYTKHRQQSQGKSPKSKVHATTTGNYWLALIFFALGLMAKPMLVTLPFLLLLLDGWPFRRFEAGRSASGQLLGLVREKWPFFLLAAISCVLTLLAQRAEAVVALENHSLALRLQNALVAYAGYLLKTVWPANLAILYPLPAAIPPLKVVGSAAILFGASFFAWQQRRTQPAILVGWLWFLGTLVPVIGIVQVGGQALADRYTYLPHIGLFIAVVFGLAAMSSSTAAGQKAVAALAGLTLLACLAGTIRQLSYWRDSERLFARAIAVTGPNPVARINLGVALEQQGRFAEARQQYEAALAMDARRVQAHNNLANLLTSQDEPQRALAHYRQALELKPDAVLAHLNLGTTLAQLGQLDEALAHYETAQRLKPDDPRPLYLSGKAVLQAGLGHEATQAFDAALRIDHQHLQSLVWLARTLAAHANAEVRNGQRALQLAALANTLTRNTDPFVLDTLAMAYAETGRFAEARETLQRAIRLLADADDPGVTQLETRMKLYESNQPYRETFTSGAGEKPARR